MSAGTNVTHSDEHPPPPPRTMPGDKVRTKKWAPKTFNGCLTCKKRRIKCDEGKPGCQRCIKSNIRCGGYAPPKIRLFDPASSSSTPTTPPAAPPTTTLAAPPGEPEPDPAPPRDPQFQSYLSSYPHPQELALVPIFGTQEDYRCFQFFLEKTSNLISVYSKPYLWSVLLPQATWHQPSIKHSVIALASLHQSLTTLGAPSQRANHNFMFHYNAAIRSLVADKPPIDIVLAACVIFWALENFNGSGQSAVDHMKAAIKILGEWKSKRRLKDPADNLISKYIEPTIRDGVKFASKCRIEELTDQMSALSLTTRDVRIMNFKHPAFGDLEDAEKYLGSCINDILTLKSQIQAQAALHSTHTVLIRELERLDELDARLYRWMHLFQNLTATGPVYMRRMLIVHNVAAHILLDQLQRQAHYSATEPEEVQDPDRDSAPECAGPERCRHNFIVIEVEDVLRHDPLTTTESCRKNPPTLGFIAPIFLVAMSAENVETRRQAINALRWLNVAEDSWSTEHAARIAEATLEMAHESALGPSNVDVQHLTFDLDEDDQTLTMEWEREPEHRAVKLTKSIDASDLPWAGLDIPELVRRYGYQFSARS
ncbi:hypothetical protein G647_06745 [Cladophialophora carrionii CBS 160.54]|uniref:Zn(2)-C6 fungal-type domain-containing protein n=1 Tax=Cladophialophora carrionii CBS 160.54 TaxID=1279043 RepID=V9D6W6_9EURO|nr:uncharacterized protein G647_06745 [Cladophialophora carrionii CBS 160.54]ETI22669.1 hypothetical protein G647_06745 [Cladophialophora carrionii CBS 160.54]